MLKCVFERCVVACAGLYKKIAVPWYTGAHNAVSCALAIKNLGGEPVKRRRSSWRAPADESHLTTMAALTRQRNSLTGSVSVPLISFTMNTKLPEAGMTTDALSRLGLSPPFWGSSSAERSVPLPSSTIAW